MLKIKRSVLGVEFNHLSSEAMKLVRHHQLKTRSLEELLRFAQLLKLRSKRFRQQRWQ